MGKYRLYAWRQTGSLAVEAAFAELGVDFDEVLLSRKTDENLTEAFRLINPRQQLPALQLPDGSIMTEGTAMLLHLADAFPEAGLAPKPRSSARAQHDRWLTFFQANIYEGELRKLFPRRYLDDEAAADSVRRAANSYVERHYMIFENCVGGGPYAFGGTFSMLDIYVWMLAQWMPQEWLAQHCPKVKALVDRVAKRPAIAPVHAKHFG
jgi:GST-like protein